MSLNPSSSRGSSGGGGGGFTTYRKVTSKQVVNSIVATDLLNGEITVAGGAMTATSMLRIRAGGTWFNNSAGNIPQPQFRLRLGGTTVMDTGATATAVQANAARNPWTFDALIVNANATNSQVVSVVVGLTFVPSSGVNNIAVTGVGRWGEGVVAVGVVAQFNGENEGLTIDTTAANLLELQVLNGATDPNVDTTLRYALVEVI